MRQRVLRLDVADQERGRGAGVAPYFVRVPGEGGRRWRLELVFRGDAAPDPGLINPPRLFVGDALLLRLLPFLRRSRDDRLGRHPDKEGDPDQDEPMGGCSKSEAGSSPRCLPPGGKVGETQKSPRGEGVLRYDHDIARTGLRDRISRSV